MGEVLGRVTASLQTRRGPDAKYRVRVERSWLENGATIELELPRNLTCAACDGGGCDMCDRSGAVSVRMRGTLPERLQVTLPACAPESGDRGVVLRIPEQGGLAVSELPLPRDMLLLSVLGSDCADPGVHVTVPSARARELTGSAADRLDSSAARWTLATVLLLILLSIGLLIWFRR